MAGKPKKKASGKRNTSAQHKKESLSIAQQKFLTAYARDGIVSDACKDAGVGRTSHYRWLKESDLYKEAFNEAHEDAADVLEKEARTRAITGKSDTLLIFLLKGARPEKYKDRAEVTGKDGAPLGGKEPTDTAVAAAIVGLLQRASER